MLSATVALHNQCSILGKIWMDFFIIIWAFTCLKIDSFIQLCCIISPVSGHNKNYKSVLRFYLWTTKELLVELHYFSVLNIKKKFQNSFWKKFWNAIGFSLIILIDNIKYFNERLTESKFIEQIKIHKKLEITIYEIY